MKPPNQLFEKGGKNCNMSIVHKYASTVQNQLHHCLNLWIREQSFPPTKKQGHIPLAVHWKFCHIVYDWSKSLQNQYYLQKFTGGSKLFTKIPRSRSLSSNFLMNGWLCNERKWFSKWTIKEFQTRTLTKVWRLPEGPRMTFSLEGPFVRCTQTKQLSCQIRECFREVED